MSTFGEAIVKVNMKCENEDFEGKIIRNVNSRWFSLDGDSFSTLSFVNGMVEDTMMEDDLSSHDNGNGWPVECYLATDCEK